MPTTRRLWSCSLVEIVTGKHLVKSEDLDRFLQTVFFILFLLRLLFPTLGLD